MIQDARFDGYYIALQVVFLGRVLRHGGAGFYKLLFLPWQGL